MSEPAQHPLRGEAFEGGEPGGALVVGGEIRQGSLVYFYRSHEQEWTIAPLPQDKVSQFCGCAYLVREIMADGSLALDPVGLEQITAEPSGAAQAWLRRVDTDPEFAAHLASKFANPKDARVCELSGDSADDPRLREARAEMFKETFGREIKGRSPRNRAPKAGRPRAS